MLFHSAGLGWMYLCQTLAANKGVTEVVTERPLEEL